MRYSKFIPGEADGHVGVEETEEVDVLARQALRREAVPMSKAEAKGGTQPVE